MLSFVWRALTVRDGSEQKEWEQERKTRVTYLIGVILGGPLPGTVSCPLGFLLFSNNSDCTSGKILKRICEEKAMCYFFFPQ